MTTKDKIRKEIDDLRSERDKLAGRRREMEGEKFQIDAKIESRAENISALLIAGKDPAKETESLVHDRIKRDGLDKALALVSQQIKTLDRRHATAAAAFFKEDFDHLTHEVDALLNTGIKQLYDAVDNLNAIDEKYKELARISKDSGLLLEDNEHLQDLRLVYRNLLGNYDHQVAPAQIGIPFILRALERRFSVLLGQIRERSEQERIVISPR